MQINRRDGAIVAAPSPETLVGDGDGVVLMGRPNRAAILSALFDVKPRLGPRG